MWRTQAFCEANPLPCLSTDPPFPLLTVRPTSSDPSDFPRETEAASPRVRGADPGPWPAGPGSGLRPPAEAPGLAESPPACAPAGAGSGPGSCLPRQRHPRSPGSDRPFPRWAAGRKVTEERAQRPHRKQASGARLLGKCGRQFPGTDAWTPLLRAGPVRSRGRC